MGNAFPPGLNHRNGKPSHKPAKIEYFLAATQQVRIGDNVRNEGKQSDFQSFDIHKWFDCVH